MKLNKRLEKKHEQLVTKGIHYDTYGMVDKKTVNRQVDICLFVLMGLYERTRNVDILIQELEKQIQHFIKHQFFKDKIAIKISVELLKLERKILKFKGEENGEKK